MSIKSASEVIARNDWWRPTGPQYAPPYDSFLEDRFAWSLVKELDRSVRLAPQRPVHTEWGDFLQEDFRF